MYVTLPKLDTSCATYYLLNCHLPSRALNLKYSLNAKISAALNDYEISLFACDQNFRVDLVGNLNQSFDLGNVMLQKPWGCQRKV